MNEEQTARAVTTLAEGGEVYAWLDQYESTTAFAFVVIYLGCRGKHWFRQRNEGWWVNLYHKQADVGADFFDCVDALRPEGDTVSHGVTERHELPTPEEALKFAVSRFTVKEFLDDATVNRRYRETYLKK